MKEIWMPVSQFSKYRVSNFGQVRSRDRWVRAVSKNGREYRRKIRGKVLRSQLQNSGYLVVHLYKANRRAVRTVHSLVARAFIGPRPKGFDICHRNGCRTDNRPSNLRYDTRKGNFKDRIKHGTIYKSNSKKTLSIPQAIWAKNCEGTLSQKTVAQMLNVSPETVRRIWKGDTWRYLK